MGWMPLPPAWPCAKMVTRKVTNIGGGIYGGSQYRLRRPCKAGFSNTRRGCRWPNFVSQETVAVAISEIYSRTSACVVAMEAYGTVHYWGREFANIGHDVRLIPPFYVKAFVKRQ